MTNNELRAWCEAEIEKCTKYGFSPEHEGKALALREVLTRIETNSRTGDAELIADLRRMAKGQREGLHYEGSSVSEGFKFTAERAADRIESITPPEVGGELVERARRIVADNGSLPPDMVMAGMLDSAAEMLVAIAALSTPEVVDGTAALVEALKPFAEQKTIDEIMQGQEPDEWAGASVERRIELIGERKQKNTENILRARTALSQHRGVS